MYLVSNTHKLTVRYAFALYYTSVFCDYFRLLWALSYTTDFIVKTEVTFTESNRESA